MRPDMAVLPDPDLPAVVRAILSRLTQLAIPCNGASHRLRLANGCVLCRHDNRGDRGSGRVYPFICEEHDRAQGGGGH